MQEAMGAVCANIGPKERNLRMAFGYGGALITVALFSFFEMAHFARWTHALVMLPAALSAAGFFQAYAHTCVAFAAQDIKVLGDSRKDAVKVTDSEKTQIAKQARAVYRNMILATIAAGILALAIP